MILEKIKLKTYRNIEEIEIKFDEKINIIYGLNGQGKTNLVESIDFLSSLKSFRGDEHISLIKLNSDFAVIEADLKEMYNKYHVRLVLSSNGLKINLNHQDLKRNGDFIGIVNVVTFSPSDISLFKDSPKKRREFLNNEIYKMSPSYYHSISDYQKILKERNELLKNEDFNERYFDILTKQLSKKNADILRKRYQFIEDLSKNLTTKFKDISDMDLNVTLKYETFIEKEEIDENVIYQKMIDKKEEDLKYRATQIGIHRDDIVFCIENKPISVFGSQGQMRMCIIAAKLSLLDLSYKYTGSRAIVVLDDVFSELDSIRQKRILEHIKLENQLFITTAQEKKQIKKLINEGKMLKITDGYLETEE